MIIKPGDVLRETYRIEEALRESQSYRSFRATHLPSGGDARIQLCLPHADGAAAARLERATAALEEIDDPRIVKALDYWVTDNGAPVVVTEFAEGDSLRAVLKQRDGTLPWPSAVEVMVRVLEGLAQLHARRVIHRNLTPESILVLPYEDHLIKLIDIGFAKPMEGKASHRITRPGLYAGALGYAAPEQVMGRRLDARSDLYTAGLILFEMVAGHLPFEDSFRNRQIALMERMKSVPPPPTAPEGKPPVPPLLGQCLTATIVPDPELRPPNAEELIEALRAVSHVAPGE